MKYLRAFIIVCAVAIHSAHGMDSKRRIEELIVEFNRLNYSAYSHRERLREKVDEIHTAYSTSNACVQKMLAKAAFSTYEDWFCTCYSNANSISKTTGTSAARPFADDAARALSYMQSIDQERSHSAAQEVLQSFVADSLGIVCYAFPLILALYKATNASSRTHVANTILEEHAQGFAQLMLDEQPARTECENTPFSLDNVITHMCNNPTDRSVEFLLEHADKLPAHHVPTIINTMRTHCTSLEELLGYMGCFESTLPELVSAYEQTYSNMLFTAPITQQNSTTWNYTANFLIRHKPSCYYPPYHTKLQELINNSHTEFAGKLETCATLWKSDKYNSYSSCAIAHWIAQQCNIPLAAHSIEDIAACSATQAQGKADQAAATIWENVYGKLSSQDTPHTSQHIVLGMHLAQGTFIIIDPIWHEYLAHYISKSPAADDTTKSAALKLADQWDRCR